MRRFRNDSFRKKFYSQRFRHCHISMLAQNVKYAHDIHATDKCHVNHTSLNPIVVGLFDSPILVGGGAKKPPYLTLDW